MYWNYISLNCIYNIRWKTISDDVLQHEFYNATQDIKSLIVHVYKQQIKNSLVPLTFKITQ